MKGLGLSIHIGAYRILYIGKYTHVVTFFCHLRKCIKLLL